MPTELAKTYDPHEAQQRFLTFWDELGCFHSEPDPQAQAVHDRDSAAERDRGPAPGARPQQHAAGRADPLAAHAGLQRPVGARHRSRRHRHAGRRGTADPAAGEEDAPRPGPRGTGQAHLAMEGQVRGPHSRPAQAARRQLRLGPHPLHARSDLCPGRAADVLRPVQGRATSSAANAWSTGTPTCKPPWPTTKPTPRTPRAASGRSNIR